MLQKYDNMVLESNVPYGMTSNRGNFHNRVSMTFLLAAYRAEDHAMAKKVSGSMKKDLEQQMKYYRSLGDESMTNETLAMQAAAVMNNKGGNLSQKQYTFAQDILSSYQMLLQLTDWEKQFKPGGAGNAVETAPGTLPAPDSQKASVDTTKP